MATKVNWMRDVYKGKPQSQWNRLRAEYLAAHPEVAPPKARAGRRDAGQIPPPQAPNVFGPEPSPSFLPEADVSAMAAETAQRTLSDRVSSEEDLPDEFVHSLFDGRMQKLTVMGRNGSITDPIPGYDLYWFNDPGNTGITIAMAHRSGWSHVTHDEVIMADTVIGGNDLGSNVSYIMNPNLVPPTRGWLMKIPRELHQRQKLEFEKHHQRIEQAMTAGTLNAKPGDRRYTAQPGSALPPIEINTKLYR